MSAHPRPIFLQDSTHILTLWQWLLVEPDTTIAAGGCLKGLLLRVASSLVDSVMSTATPQLELQQVGLALMRLLEVTTSLDR